VTARDVIDALLSELRENVGFLEPLRTLTLQEYERDVPRRKMAERCFQIAIECLIDIAHHLVSEHSWGHARTGEQAIEILAARGVIPGPLRARLQGVAGFRNVLVHAYVEIDHARVHSNLARLGDLREFGREVQAFIDKGFPSPPG
jgi:uncharacterized protein YutE (UPF0331/DUF86 family)